MIRAPHGRLLGFIDPSPRSLHAGRRWIYEDPVAREYRGQGRPPAQCPIRAWTADDAVVHWTHTLAQMEAHYGAKLKRPCVKRVD